jgi:uncharacterized membrane protein YfcA
MNTTTILLLVFIGLLAGVLSGFIGIGGGLVIVPALVYLVGMNQHIAQGTSLVLMLPPIGILAVMNYYKADMLNLKYAGIIAATFIVGGYFGSKLSLTVSPAIVKKVFAISMILVAVKMLVSK